VRLACVPLLRFTGHGLDVDRSDVVAQLALLSGAEGHVRPRRLGLRSGFGFAVGQIVKYFVERFYFRFYITNPRNRAVNIIRRVYFASLSPRKRYCLQWFEYV
jgi:hypothetical protein